MVIGVISGCVLIPRSGKLSFGSWVNTDENWLFSISALDLASLYISRRCFSVGHSVVVAPSAADIAPKSFRSLEVWRDDIFDVVVACISTLHRLVAHQLSEARPILWSIRVTCLPMGVLFMVGHPLDSAVHPWRLESGGCHF